jgi:hypothetical protein
LKLWMIVQLTLVNSVLLQTMARERHDERSEQVHIDSIVSRREHVVSQVVNIIPRPVISA